MALDKVEETVRQTIREIGYVGDIGMKFDADTCAVIRTLHGQSADISMGVTETDNREQGAGDQGIMFGFACRETKELMPMPILLSHRLMERQAQVRRQGKVKGLRPDAKSQVTIEYDDTGKTPLRIDTVVLSTQHTPDWNGKAKQAKLKEEVIKHIIEPVMPRKLWDRDNVVIHVNPTGQFEVGGPHGDTGLTGRKIIVDSYGGRGRHGGGAFSGKDPTKVDRSAAYMARYIAKNIVAADLADECEVQLGYAIGYPEPVSILVDTHGTARIDEKKISLLVREFFPLKPAGILGHLRLRRPIYRQTATHGHFGRELPDFTWEATDLADKLAREANGA
jgi:S-adenosylmethionine synthetase